LTESTLPPFGVTAPETTAASRLRLGAVLRDARGRRSLSLSEVGRETGVSASFLSLVENGKSDIAIGRLVRILSFLEVPISDVLSEPSPVDANFVRVNERRRLPSTDEGIEFFLLTADTDHLMMPMLIVFQPAAQLAEYGCHHGEEFVHVLGGRMNLELRNKPPQLLTAGESAYYRADQPHLFGNASDVDLLHLLCVNAPPNLKARSQPPA
jgi:quercetin dioxygenase-like cupin family protein/DNA-binding Xre family transcriptional regulator